MRFITSILIFSMFFLFSAVSIAFQTDGFLMPYDVIVDSSSGDIYVSNMNGGFDVKNANGFISKLKPDGTVDTMRFIGSGGNGRAMHSPKGMAIIDSRLYVADINLLRVFDLKTGKFLYNINFGKFDVRHFVGLVKGPKGALYVTDASLNTIYKVDVAKQHEVSIFASGNFLNTPHGICFDAIRQSFIVVGNGGSVSVLDIGGKRRIFPAIKVSALEGCAVDSNDNIYVSSGTFNDVFQITKNFALYGFVLGRQKPAGIAFRPNKNDLLVVSTAANSVQSVSVSVLK